MKLLKETNELEDSDTSVYYYIEENGDNLIPAFGENDGTKTEEDISYKEISVSLKVVAENITEEVIRNEDRLIKENKSPFLKRNVILFKVVYLVTPIFTRRLIKKYTKYNYELIWKDRKQNISIHTQIGSYISALRRFILRIHFKSGKIYFLGKWYQFRKLEK